MARTNSETLRRIRHLEKSHDPYPELLKWLVDYFVNESKTNSKGKVGTEQELHDDYLSSLKSITDFVCGEVNSPGRKRGDLFKVDNNHQRWFNSKPAKYFVEEFIRELEVTDPIIDKEFDDFEALFNETVTHQKSYIGPTALYDFALRFGWNRNVYAGKDVIVPEKRVYLHTGPLRSAVLVFDLLEGEADVFPQFEVNYNVKAGPREASSYYVMFDELPELFKASGMKAKDVEHFLCIMFPELLTLIKKKFPSRYKGIEDKEIKTMIKVLDKHLKDPKYKASKRKK